MGEVWTKYKVKGVFVEKVFGGIPSDPEIVEGFLASKKELHRDEKAAAKAIIEKSQELNTVDGAVSKLTNIFRVDENGIYLDGFQFNAALREAMSIQRSITMWRSKMTRGVRVLPPRVYLTRKGEHISYPDGHEQTVCHSEVMGQPVTSIKRVAFIDKPEFEFEVWVGNDKEGPILSAKHLKGLLEHIEITGIGSRRSMGAGMCMLKLVEEEKKKAEKETKAEPAKASA